MNEMVTDSYPIFFSFFLTVVAPRMVNVFRLTWVLKIMVSSWLMVSIGDTIELGTMADRCSACL